LPPLSDWSRCWGKKEGSRDHEEDCSSPYRTSILVEESSARVFRVSVDSTSTRCRSKAATLRTSHFDGSVDYSDLSAGRIAVSVPCVAGLGMEHNMTFDSLFPSGVPSFELATEPPRELTEPVEGSRRILASGRSSPHSTGLRTICFPTLCNSHLPSLDGRHPSFAPSVLLVTSELTSTI
jgi:hypothetical protein